LQAPSKAAAHRKLLTLMLRAQCTPLRACERGSRIAQLRQWEAFERSNHVWMQADASAVSKGKEADPQHVKSCIDLSGRGNGLSSGVRMPVFVPESINGHAAIEFDGRSVLKTRPFARPLPQPVTLIVVARARGDTTIVDSLGPGSSRFELCHGYPAGWHQSPEVCMTASGHDAAPKASLRGSTRGTGAWHIYTAIFDHRRSECFVDGACEASGTSVGGNELDGLSVRSPPSTALPASSSLLLRAPPPPLHERLPRTRQVGCDHSGVFFLTGARMPV
jgi:hypothetical protein